MRGRMILLGTLLVFVSLVSVGEAFREPPYIPIQKPAPASTIIVEDTNGFSSALETAEPGTLVLLKAGIYKAPTISNSGESGNEIVIEPYGDGMVYIEVSGHRNHWNWYGDHIILDGGPNRQITLRKNPDTEQIASLLRLRGDNQAISRVLLQGPIGNCDTPTNALISPNNGGNPPGKPSNYRIYNNILDSYSHKGIYAAGTVNGEIRNNIIRGGQGHAIQFNPHDGSSYVDGALISGNLIINNGLCAATNKGGKAIMIDGDDSRGGTISNITICNNIIAGNANAGIDLLSDDTDLIGPENIYNNTIYNNSGHGINIDNVMPGSLVSIYNNIIYSNSAGTINDQTRSSSQGNNLTDDPDFISTAQSDINYLMLSSSSISAIDKGMNIGITTDYFDHTRDSLPDIGAHEYTADNDGDNDVDGMDLTMFSKDFNSNHMEMFALAFGRI